ncbi:CTP synthase [Pajaroellobacter abortibovis]|uniref:CTP synthase n=2 Tax=Pajaroellobacter abortibovis TaxID=1882918 RepID=A0A1L6MY37_9BACT|nr:CTP synthase [Pajaroellobacter abortibovis]APS00406.1 CTP synthase [Pajaroellobacter abortibovis]
MAYQKQPKYIFVTGGVVSSIGKGLTSASVGALLEARGLSVTLMKLDPYINVDPGTMSPYQHGEVFVTEDGAETDLDLGHYERFTNAKIGRDHNITAGRIYGSVIAKERRGEYLGATVQVIPHITDEIKTQIRTATAGADVAIIEVGGTAGDIESLPFLEAVRQLKLEAGFQNSLNLHVTLVPYIATAGELKTKPTQHSVKEMLKIGIQPDVIICRTENKLPLAVKEKIALSSNVPLEAVISASDVQCIYEAPLLLHEEGVDDLLCARLNIWSRHPNLAPWKQVVERFKVPSQRTAHIVLVGKYVHLKDAYKSLHEAVVHAGLHNDCHITLHYIDAEQIEKEGPSHLLKHVDAILVPGGFGNRGTEGMVSSIQYAREHQIPFFGICLGMQVAVIEFARHVAGLIHANSMEFDPRTPYPVIDLMSEQQAVKQKGATMRLGTYPCVLLNHSRVAAAYGTKTIGERHRHRYEVANRYREQLAAAGLVFSGTSPDNHLVEIIELKDHPYFVGCQFHPEFKSRPSTPHPLFAGFVQAALEYSKNHRSSDSS